MRHFLETICIENGVALHLDYHQQRMDDTLLAFNYHPKIKLRDIIIPERYISGLYKCRIVYCRELIDIQFIPYTIPVINSLKLVDGADVYYPYKYVDRRELVRLYEKRHGCDDVLILRNGQLSDSYFANIVCVKDGIYYTPDTPLLPGTRRARLLEEGTIFEASITTESIKMYEYITLINAMLSLDRIKVPIAAIH